MKTFEDKDNMKTKFTKQKSEGCEIGENISLIRRKFFNIYNLSRYLDITLLGKKVPKESISLFSLATSK